jgi:hypothetical protein
VKSERPDRESGQFGKIKMLAKTLLGFSIVCNFATLLGLWIAYKNSPTPLQGQIGYILLLSGAAASIIAYLAFAWFVMRPIASKKPEKATETKNQLPSYNIPPQDQIYIHIPQTTTCIIGDRASTNVSFFSARDIRLTYCKVTFAIQGEEFALDSSEPLEIPAFHATEASLKRSLTSDEKERVGEGRGRILHYSGIAVFSGNLQKNFWGMVMEFI